MQESRCLVLGRLRYARPCGFISRRWPPSPFSNFVHSDVASDSKEPSSKAAAIRCGIPIFDLRMQRREHILGNVAGICILKPPRPTEVKDRLFVDSQKLGPSIVAALLKSQD